MGDRSEDVDVDLERLLDFTLIGVGVVDAYRLVLLMYVDRLSPFSILSLFGPSLFFCLAELALRALLYIATHLV